MRGSGSDELVLSAQAETFDWGAADIEKALRARDKDRRGHLDERRFPCNEALRSFLEAFLLPKEGT